jgi:PKD repeat protein
MEIVKMRNFKIIALSLLILVLLIELVSANQFSNPGFETGVLSPWTSTPSPDYAVTSQLPRSGSYCCHAWVKDGGAHQEFLNQSITLSSSNAVSVYFMNDRNLDWNNCYVNVRVDNIIVATSAISYVAGYAYTRYNFNFTSSPGTHTFSLELVTTSEKSSTGGYLFIDDFFLDIPAVSAPIASFTASPTSGDSPLSVAFTDTSTNTPTSWLWNFGDGSTSPLQNPSHTYYTNGSYTVNLTATNAGGSYTLSKVNYINVGSGSGSGGYGNGSIPFEAHFLDTSSGSPDAFYWDFGDGNTSTLQNPVHTYYTAGDYDIYHTSGKTGEWLGSQYKLDWVHVAVGGSYFAIKDYPVGDMSLSATSGTIPLTVDFTAGTVGTPTSWLWVFGDSSVNSTSQNPSHIYNGAGPFSPYIKSTNANGYGELIKYDYISATLPGITADFTANRTTVTPGQGISFLDSSTGSLIDSWSWTFGDGSTSTATNVIKSYSAAGTYTVTHTASSSSTGLSDTETKTNYITVSGSTGYVDVDFAANVTYGSAPLTVAFNDASANSPTSFTWDFGDGGSSTEENTVHKYTSVGIYTVIHTATNEYGTGSLTKQSYIQVYAAGYGGIDGYVYDSSTSNVLSGATLTIQNYSASAQYVTSTDGVYYFWPVYNGVYNLTAAKTGYVTQSFPNTIINGTTSLFNIYLTPGENQASGINITNYSNDWLTYSYATYSNNNTIVLAYTVTNGTMADANFTVYTGNSVVYTSAVSDQTKTFSYIGSASNNYAVTFVATNTEDDTYNAVFSAIFYRGLPTGYSPFPTDYPSWLLNLIVIGFAILMLLVPGSAYNWMAGVFVELVLGVGWYWGLLNLGATNVIVLMGIIAVVTVAEYMKFSRRIGD